MPAAAGPKRDVERGGIDRTMGYLFIALTVLFTVYGQLIIKHEIDSVGGIPTDQSAIGYLIKFMFLRPLVLSGLFSAVLASFAWVAALSKFELSYAYPFMSLNFVVVVALSIALFGETLNAYKFIGIALICLGVFVVSRGTSAPPLIQETRPSEMGAMASAPMLPLADPDAD
jgi:drug/metabolite transporter (DMT)-like permease